jgi:hypothetical protein
MKTNCIDDARSGNRRSPSTSEGGPCSIKDMSSRRISAPISTLWLHQPRHTLAASIPSSGDPSYYLRKKTGVMVEAGG